MASPHRRGTATESASRAALLLLALLLGPTLAVAQQPAAPGEWKVVTDISHPGAGLDVSVVGPRQASFPRPPPRTLDPHLLTDYGAQLNLLQDVVAEVDTPFTATSDQYVATVHRGFVEGEGGLVYDADGHVLHLPHHFFTRTSPLQPMPLHTVEQAAATCERHGALASVVHRYGHMYYHFVMETLPRVALLMESGRLTSDVKLLTWGQPYEYEYLEALGVEREQVVPYNASRVYCADRLLVPTPTPRVTPPREGLLAVRGGLGVRTLPEAQRDLIVHVSRRGEATRRVGNEEALLAAIRAAFPTQQVVMYSGADGLSAAETIALFQRARVVLGPHGAGLSHILFSAPGTTVVEFHFLADPPLMFWHAAGALGQPYWLLPVPQAFWMQEEMQVPVEEVVDILTAVLKPTTANAHTCLPGTYAASADGAVRCTACSAGSYAFNAGSAACKPCASGRVSTAAGATACRTCQPGTYSSADGRECIACPTGTFSTLPGAWTPTQCLTPDQRRRQQEDQALSLQLLSKLSPVFEETRRRLIEQAVVTGVPLNATTQAALCEAQKLAGTFSDPYRGPYLLGAPTATALLANCSDLVVPPVVVVVPASPPLPPVDVPELPPVVAPSPSPSPSPAPVPVKPQSVPEEPEPQVYPAKKKVVDDYVIILACVLGGLLVLPLLAWLGRRMWLAHQHRKSRASAAAKRPLMDNPTFQPRMADEDAASTSSGRLL